MPELEKYLIMNDILLLFEILRIEFMFNCGVFNQQKNNIDLLDFSN